MSILTIEHLTHRFGEKVLYEEASLQVNKGDHLGLTGQNGVSKSTLIKILTGKYCQTKERFSGKKLQDWVLGSARFCRTITNDG